MTVENRHTEVIIESQFKWSGSQFLVPVHLFVRTESKMPLPHDGSGIAGTFHHIRNCGACRINLQSLIQEDCPQYPHGKDIDQSLVHNVKAWKQPRMNERP